MLKLKIYHLVEKGDHGAKINILFDYAIITLILLNVAALILESIPEVQVLYGLVLYRFEVFSVVIFSAEYMGRLLVADLTHPAENGIKSRLKFVFSFYGLIDLLAILPFFLPLLIVIDLRFLRILRFMRFLRILKINRYNRSINLIFSVVKEKKMELTVSGFVTLLVIVLASFLMYYVEGSAQPDKFPNIIASFWWAIATLTTVGYGDVYPITPFGKLISGIIAVMGIGIVALPTGIISAGFMEKIAAKEPKECPHCGKSLG